MKNFLDKGNLVHIEEEVMVMTFYPIFQEVKWEEEDFLWEVYHFHTQQQVLEDREYIFQAMEEAEDRILNKIDKDSNNQKFQTQEIM